MSDVSSLPSLQEQKREFTRSRLLDAALTLFSSKGYEATTAENIATAVGCSRATFYLHFSSKSAAMIAILDRAWPDVVDIVTVFSDRLTAGLTKKEMRLTIRELVGYWRSTPGAVRAVLVALLTDDEVAAWLRENSAIAFDILSGLRTGRRTRAKLQKRSRIAALSRMTLAALDLGEDQQLIESEALVDYLTDLWADLLVRTG